MRTGIHLVECSNKSTRRNGQHCDECSNRRRHSRLSIQLAVVSACIRARCLVDGEVLELGKDGIACDLAHVRAITCPVDIAAHAPVGAPRILDQVVVLTLIGAVSNNSDCMVGLLSRTRGVDKDAFRVILECLRGIDSNSNGADFGNSRSKGTLETSRRRSACNDNAGLLRHLCSTAGSKILASELVADVVVAVQCVNAAVAEDIREGDFGVASVAAVTRGRAVQQILWRERVCDRGVVLENLSLEGCRGRKRPARPALALILHISYAAQSHPVNAGRRRGVGGKPLNHAATRGQRAHILLISHVGLLKLAVSNVRILIV
eukprot:Opistho-2@79638